MSNSSTRALDDSWELAQYNSKKMERILSEKNHSSNGMGAEGKIMEDNEDSPCLRPSEQPCCQPLIARPKRTPVSVLASLSWKLNKAQRSQYCEGLGCIFGRARGNGMLGLLVDAVPISQP